MKAYVLHGVGDLRYEEVAKPELKKDTVLVKVWAAGVCGSDIPRIYRTGAYSHPLIPGHEFAGEVVAVGDDADVTWIGKRVGVFPLIPCKECAPCSRKQYEMCGHYNYLGSRTDGGFAEYVCVPVWNLIELPENVGFEQAAMLEPMAVAMHAIRKIGVQQEECIAVCGLGTIGLLVVMFLQSMGCKKIYVIGNKDIQVSKARELGLDEAQICDLRKQDAQSWMEEVTSGCGVDVFFDCVGRNEVINEAITCVSPGGRIMLVGNPASDMHLDKNVYWKILRKQLTLQGTWNSSYTGEETDDWHQVLKLLQAEAVCPKKLITHRYEFPELYLGMECMRDKSEEYIKIMGVL